MYYAIVKFSLEGNEILDGYDDYEAAECVIDDYCDKYPHSIVDIVEVNN